MEKPYLERVFNNDLFEDNKKGLPGEDPEEERFRQRSTWRAHPKALQCGQLR